MNRDDERINGADLVFLALAIDPLPPTRAIRERVRERLLARVAGTGGQGAVGTRLAEGEWRRLLPGIEIKRLCVEPEQGRETCLWRLMPGAVIPPHPHPIRETCLVVVGDVELEGVTWTRGDWIEIEAGADHGSVRARTESLLLISSAPLPI